MVDPIQLKAREDTWDEAKQKSVQKAAEFNEIQHKVLDARVAFYEKLALFDTGTIAATISMIATIRQQQALHWEYVLFAGWIVLLIAMALCLIRNSCAHAHLYYEASAHFNWANARREEAGLAYLTLHPATFVNDLGEPENKEEYLEQSAKSAKKYTTLAHELEKKSGHRYGVMRWSSHLASLLTTIGISLILTFAIRNLGNISTPVVPKVTTQPNQLPIPSRSAQTFSR